MIISLHLPSLLPFFIPEPQRLVLLVHLLLLLPFLPPLFSSALSRGDPRPHQNREEAHAQRSGPCENWVPTEREEFKAKARKSTAYEAKGSRFAKTPTTQPLPLLTSMPPPAAPAQIIIGRARERYNETKSNSTDSSYVCSVHYILPQAKCNSRPSRGLMI